MSNYITQGPSKIYRRETIAGLKPTKDKSLQYWRKQARDIFARRSCVNIVEVVIDGCKTSSQILARGETKPVNFIHVIIASTGGKWGKSRREYWSE